MQNPLKILYLSGQILAASHDFTPNGGLVGEIPLFQKNLGWWTGEILCFGQIYNYCFGNVLFWKKKQKRSCHPCTSFWWSLLCCQKQGTVSPGKSRNGKTVGNGGKRWIPKAIWIGKKRRWEKNMVSAKKQLLLKNKNNIRKMQVNIYILCTRSCYCYKWSGICCICWVYTVDLAFFSCIGFLFCQFWSSGVDKSIIWFTYL